jgi:outer membrane protein insertion porin family
MFIKILKINIFIFFLITYSLAEIVKDIKVFGNKRISKETIIVLGKIKFDVDYNDNKLNEIFKNLYQSDFFNKIEFNLKSSILEITIDENPIIEDLEIVGIKSSNLTKFILEKLSLQSRRSYIESALLSDLNLIKSIIKSNGYYFSEIKTQSILNEEQNSVKLIFDIDLGEKAKINEIQFFGNKNVKDRKLNNVITSEEARFWKFLSQSVYLNNERIELDKRLLENFYKNNGYYDVKISNSFVEFKNNKYLKLIYNIESGEKFTFNKLDINLSDDYDEKYFIEIKKSLKKLENEEYSLDRIEKVLREVDKIALSKQYMFIDATLKEKVVDKNKLDIIISLEDTEKFYVEKINVLGNEFTIEEVIRNSFIVDEGDPFNEILFNKSINNLKAKNIFGSVDHSILPGSEPNLKIIDLTVTEKPTGEISLAAGLGSTGGSIGGGIKENNFLGKGIKLDASLQFSENSIKGGFVYEKPNFNYTDNTLFTSITSTTTDNLSDHGYKTSNFGVSFGTSFQQYEDLYFSPKISSSFENLETSALASSALKKQEGNYFDTNFNYSLNYVRTNKRYRPDDGFVNSFFQELPIISENYEITNSFTTTRYQKFSEMVTKISFFGKAVNTLADEDVRISQRLFMPANKLRGFEAGKIGPKENNDYIGGNYVSSINFSTTLPQLLTSFQNADLSFFIDAANIWGVDYDSSIDDGSTVRSAAGFGVDLLTPIGPLSFSLSQPITKASTDTTESFRFNLGTTF